MHVKADRNDRQDKGVYAEICDPVCDRAWRDRRNARPAVHGALRSQSLEPLLSLAEKFQLLHQKHLAPLKCFEEKRVRVLRRQACSNRALPFQALLTVDFHMLTHGCLFVREEARLRSREPDSQRLASTLPPLGQHRRLAGFAR